jgi:hypothetical protein
LTVRFFVVAAAALSLAGCAKDINNKEAVKAAIEKRVAKTGFDVNAMTVNVTQVSFHGQDAVATVAFIPKGGPEQGAVTFKYNLHREKDEWVATGLSQGGNMAAHTGMAPDTPVDPSRPLPAGHPPIGTPPAGKQP